MSPAWPLRPQPGGLELRAGREDCARPARIDMPAAQADAGPGNANKAGWRGLLRARALCQEEGADLRERPAEGVRASDEPLSSVLEAQAAGKAPSSQCGLAQPC